MKGPFPPVPFVDLEPLLPTLAYCLQPNIEAAQPLGIGGLRSWKAGHIPF